MKVSDYIAAFLAGTGCEYVFGYPGGAVTHLIDSLYRTPGIRLIGCCHEQAAAFAAEGYARRKGAPGVAMATSGPGATNLITGIGSAYFDSVPVVYLTGQVNTYEYKGRKKLRQLGFQETDIVSIAAPVTKYAVRVTDPMEIRRELEKSMRIAVSGRPGPVLLDLPMDLQREDVPPEALDGDRETPTPVTKPDVGRVVELLNASRRPVLLAGGGIRLSGAEQKFRELAGRLRIPVVSSLMGLDVCAGMENSVGMIGSYGCRCANFTVANSDLVLAIGTRLDTRQTGTNPESFARGARLIRVDIDPDELEHEVKRNEFKIQADAGAFLEELLSHAGEICSDTEEWEKTVRGYQNRYPAGGENGPGKPNRILERLSGLIGPEDAVCLDVGQNQMWAAQSLHLWAGNRLLTSGGMGAMGFALPCAVGAWYAGSRGKVLAVTGDGGMQMNLQELEVLARDRIPVKILVFNNQSLGMIRQFQELYFDGRLNATVDDYGAPDFCKIAGAYGIENTRVREGESPEKLSELLNSPEPALIEFALPQTTLVVPKLEVGRPVEDQNPLLPREELRRNMIVEPYGEARRYRAKIRAVFNRYKGIGGDFPPRRIPVPDESGAAAAFLRPVTADFRVSLPGIESLLSKWRNENPGLNAKPFTATPEGTAVWLDRLVIGKEDRLLFLIQAPDGKPVGHIGFADFDYEEKSCEVDAVLRGEKSARPGLMGFALMALLRWGRRELGLQVIRLRVFQDNPHAIRFYRKNGFVVEREEQPGENGEGKCHTVMRYSEENTTETN
ncbi:3D-(3,5/4)-trihydroxycyclohexane-1,2-dione hydrolase [Caprobacter fermentans]|uniref:3D-(3,5/4)-trihydroxycyclohexane-1,2-dione hydrolase n=1 Tax=Caproicibacter fermentans TaxID=2576756 RepID=A0A6N8HWI5_9FIRM|nr:GNAT family N-acetyltransferase [Caproicibacter fermentans]MVB10028.1 3D-(3,5/4)-trihydroxycyclohexane-1,2-dione hydrolase [Caproicibacter fermentans]OCN02578.1 hypothetical protein A7X67_05495 [Clostridium sp. W14A]